MASAVLLLAALAAACGEGGGDPASAEGSAAASPGGSATASRSGPSPRALADRALADLATGPSPTGPSAGAPLEGESGPGGATSVEPSPPSDARAEEVGAMAALAEAAQEAAQQQREDDAARGPVLGADVSWPQCPRGMGIPEKRTLGAPMPLPAARYVVVGLTNGPGFTRNPCLADQVAWVRSRGLLLSAYAVASLPSDAQVAAHADDGPFDGGTRLGRLRNAGVAQGRYNLASMRDAGMRVPAVWVDVEPVPDFAWSDDRGANAAVVQGLVRAYRDAGLRVGFYSTPLLWRGVVGDLAPGLPEWRAAGQTSRAEALSRCGSDWSFQGGVAVLGQWVGRGRDQNVTCPGQAGRLRDFFSR